MIMSEKFYHKFANKHLATRGKVRARVDFYDVCDMFLEQSKQLQAENKKLKEQLGLARGELTVDKDTGKLVKRYKP